MNTVQHRRSWSFGTMPQGVSKQPVHMCCSLAQSQMPGVRGRWEVAQPPQLSHEEDKPPEHHNPFVIGDQVYLKWSSWCNEPWSGPHHVTEVRSDVIVVINNGVAWHISHLQRVPGRWLPEAVMTDSEDSSDEEPVGEAADVSGGGSCSSDSANEAEEASRACEGKLDEDSNGISKVK